MNLVSAGGLRSVPLIVTPSTLVHPINRKTPIVKATLRKGNNSIYVKG